MLVLSRKTGESICIGSDIVVTVHSIRRTQVRLCVEAPKDVRILREELLNKSAARQPLRTAKGAGEGHRLSMRAV